MAITLGSLIEIVVNMRVDAQVNLNAWQYQVDGSAFLVEPVQIAEAWWNHVKTTYRGIIPSTWANVFQSVRILELNNPTGDYAEYSVPTGEKVGTRTVTGSPEGMPPFTAVGVRLSVGSRVTRPGQKRFPGLTELDQAAGVVQSAMVTAVNAHMAVMTEQMILGAPAATIVLNPVVTRRDATGFVLASQPITGWVTNPNVTSQNSRKFGVGI